MNTNLQISASLLVNGFIRVDSCGLAVNEK